LHGPHVSALKHGTREPLSISYTHTLLHGPQYLLHTYNSAWQQIGRGCQARMNTCRPDEWKLCRTYLGPFVSFFPDIPFFLEEKQDTEIFPTFETKEGAKYLERVAFRYLKAKKEIWKLKRIIQKQYRNIVQAALR